MSKYPNITFTLTIDNEENSLKVQATCDEMSREQILSSIEILKQKIISGELETPDAVEKGGYYLQETFSFKQQQTKTEPKEEIAQFYVKYTLNGKSKLDSHACAVSIEPKTDADDMYCEIIRAVTVKHNYFNTFNHISLSDVVVDTICKLN